MNRITFMAGLAAAAALTVGVEAAVFHGSARVLVTGQPNANEVFLFDAAGNLTGSYPQIAGARTDTWGYRDGTTDGTHVYFGWGGGVARHNADGSNPTLIIAGAAPAGVGTWRALSYDPNGNNGAGSLWSASFGSDLIEVDMNGNLLNTHLNGGYSLYGLAMIEGDPDHLWGHSGGGEVVKIRKADGMLVPGGWTTGFANLSAQGGLSSMHDGTGNVAAVSQGTPDELGVYNNLGSLIGGPWDMEGQTGSNGHLGVAVIPAPGALVLLGLGGLVAGRRRRR